MTTIAAEHFTLTPTIRAHIEDNLAKLGNLLPKSTSLSIFLSEPARKTFMVLCKVHVWGKDFVVRVEDENLYKAVDAARLHLTRKIVDEKHRWVRLRRRNTHSNDLLITNESPLSVAI